MILIPVQLRRAVEIFQTEIEKSQQKIIIHLVLTQIRYFEPNCHIGIFWLLRGLKTFL